MRKTSQFAPFAIETRFNFSLFCWIEVKLNFYEDLHCWEVFSEVKVVIGVHNLH